MTTVAMQTDHILWFEELSLADEARVGGKGANLGELASAGFAVPPGFVVTAGAFLEAMDAAGVRGVLASTSAAIDPSDPESLDAGSGRLRRMVTEARMPSALRDEIAAAYGQLAQRVGGADGRVTVAVRSSAVGEDSADTSFAGMNSSFTNVNDVEGLIEAVVACWASLYGRRVVAYRVASGVLGEPAIAVVVQQMVDVVAAGVAFSVDPSTGSRSRLVIEAARGQGEVVVGGLVEPDTYLVDRDAHREVEAHTGDQAFMIVRGSDGRDQRVALEPGAAAGRVLDRRTVLQVAELVEAVEAHYGVPQDVEFAIDPAGATFVVQARPITTITAPPGASAGAGEDEADGAVPGSGEGGAAPAGPAVLAHGLAAAPGVASGAVRVLRDPSEGDQLRAGEVLVAPMTTPDWVPVLRRAAAVVTDRGGMTCHAAIICRELGIPAVVGARTATTALRDGEIVPSTGAPARSSRAPVRCRRPCPRWPRRPRWPCARPASRRRRSTPRRWAPGCT